MAKWLIVIGASIFILVLAVSAYFEADIRWLHFFQAWMYIATIVLCLRGNRWGYFVGIGAAGLWAYTNFFVTGWFVSGLHYLMRLDRPDQIIAVPAWLANVLVVIGCVWAYARMRERQMSDAIRFLLAFALTTGFFALDIFLFQPRYLELFPRMLHPHWPT